MTARSRQSMLSHMSTDDERRELVRLVTYLMSGDGTQEEQDAAFKELDARVLHPRVSALIFWPSHEGFDELTPDEVVDIVLAYRPIEL